MIEPELSCVIPTYNDRVNLRRAVDSALGQQGVHVEVVLVDDRSDDATREFIDDLAKKDERIRTFFLPTNGGQGRARNLGAMLARGRYLAFLDQDDEHAPGWYQKARDHLDSHPSLGALSGHARVIDIPARLGIDESDLRIRGLSLVFVTNMVLRRSVFLASGGFPAGAVWRSRIAGEDGVYRQSLVENWNGAACGDEAVIHRAKEGGATVYFLDRSAVVDGRVVITRHDEIETNGVLQAAQDGFWRRGREIAAELRHCLRSPEGDAARRP